MPTWSDLVFDDIFAAPLVCAPTPVATPIFSHLPEGQSFGGNEQHDVQVSPAQRIIALRVVKSFLQSGFKSQDALGYATQSKQDSQLKERTSAVGKGKMTAEVSAAMKLSLAHWPNRTAGEEDLLEWYLDYIREDYYRVVVPKLSPMWFGTVKALNHPKQLPRWAKKPLEVLKQTCNQLHLAQNRYSLAVQEYMLPALKDSQLDMSYSADPDRGFARIFSKRLSSMFIYSLPMEDVYTALTLATQLTCIHGFQLQAGNTHSGPVTRTEWSSDLMLLYEALQRLGLGGAPAVRAVAKAVESVIALFIRSRMMEVDWLNKEPVTETLRFWVKEGLASWVAAATKLLDPDNDMDVEDEARQWLAMGIDELGKLRVKELFGFICRWPQSLGAILDIKAYIVTPEARKYLTAKFQEDVQRRLLHAGATTRQILDVYMLVIQTFTTLDSRGVLLDNVSRPIRKYLKGRQDTARIIISSMLTDTSDPRVIVSDLEISVAIASEMLKPINLSTESQRQDSDLDYDNMDYMPQPNDASSDFKKNESSDAISHLFSLYDREQFVSVLQDILGEHLLKHTDDLHLERETHLLELFKARFGEERLQACEVMLRDVTNSRRMNKKIREIPEYAQGAAAPQVGGTELNAQILSSFFWPDLRDDEFEVPTPVKELQNLYEKGFESHHNLMRLKWLPSLGRATVKLKFSDRVVNDVVPTWVASLIYAFDDSNSDGELPVTKTVTELKTELAMDEALILSGLLYWTNKRVLEEVQSGEYAVIEQLPTEEQSGTRGLLENLPQEEVSAVKSAQDRFDENAHMYRQFVQGMLTNGGNMSLGMILSMLKVVIPTGFPFGETELKGLLQSMVDESKVVCQGDVYSVRKG